MPENPIDAGAQNERALHDLLLSRMRGIRRLDERSLFDAIRTGRYGPITQSEAWSGGLGRATKAAQQAELALLRRGWLQGVSEIPGGAELRKEAGPFAQRWAGQRTHSFLATFEAENRRAMRRQVRNAAARWARAPSLESARQMAEQAKGRLGLTRAQARQLEAYERVARKAGVPDSVIERELAKRAGHAMETRARFAAEREAVETMNFARAAAWAEARRRGIVGPLEKHWRDVGDSRVRASHAAQTRVGWIPWAAVYEFHGVKHPPSPDPGCRCFESIRQRRAA